MTRDEVIAAITAAFAPTQRPGDAFIQGSREGCEPFEETSPFFGRDWSALDAAFLDEHYSALSFFSEGGFRYFLPAYLIADLRDELKTADPIFHLTQGFTTRSSEIPAGSETFTRSFGGRVLLNPLRYGAMTWRDHTLFRLSVFTREEAGAILAYLEYKRDSEPDAFDHDDIVTAIDVYSRERTKSAPTHEQLRVHNAVEQRFMSGIREPS